MRQESEKIPRFCTIIVPQIANLLLVTTDYIRGGEITTNRVQCQACLNTAEVRKLLRDCAARPNNKTTNRKVLTTNQHLFLLSRNSPLCFWKKCRKTVFHTQEILLPFNPAVVPRKIMEGSHYKNMETMISGRGEVASGEERLYLLLVLLYQHVALELQCWR